MKKTYRLQKDRPRAEEWASYVLRLNRRWRRLLSKPDLSEKELHAFLERYSALIPGASGVGPGGHHGSMHWAVISKPPLPGIRSPVPDFMWVTRDSGAVRPVLVEIERPGKPWFNKNGSRSAHFTQAESQLEQWSAWFDNPANQLNFFDLYRVSQDWREHRSFEPAYCLVYGRRQDFDDVPALAKSRGRLRDAHVVEMTFDRLEPDWAAHTDICIEVRKGEFVAKTIPPTFELGPLNAHALNSIRGLEMAIKRNSDITPARRRFLLERLPYWLEWGSKGERGIIRLGDAE